METLNVIVSSYRISPMQEMLDAEGEKREKREMEGRKGEEGVTVTQGKGGGK